MNNYWHLIKQFNIPRLAINNKFVDTKAAFNFLSVFTKTALIWKYIIYIIFKFNLHRIIFPRLSLAELPMQQTIVSSVVYRLEKFFKTKITLSVVFFPKNRLRSKVSFLISVKDKYYYVKCAFSNDTINELVNEMTNYCLIDHYDFKTFRYPSLLEQLKNESFLINIYDYIPTVIAQKIKWEKKQYKIWFELIEKTKQSISINNINWFEQSLIQNLVDKNIIKSEEIIETCISHGDFAPWNIGEYLKETILFDFEETRDKSSLLTDPIHYFLAIQYFIKKEKAAQTFHKLIKFVYSLYNNYNLSINNAITFQIYFALADIYLRSNVFPKAYIKSLLIMFKDKYLTL